MDENNEVKDSNVENQSNANNDAQFNVSAEDLKRETSETVNQVKETIKNVDLKKDSKEAKGFLSSFFKNPLGELKKVTSDSSNKFLKIAIIVLVIWLVAILASNIISVASRYLFSSYGSFSYFFKNLFSNLLSIIKALVAPIISVAVLSGLVYGFKKNKDKSFVSIFSGVLVAKIPVVAATVVSLLTIISSKISSITSQFSLFCNILSTVLLYFAIKNLSDETENDAYFWKFALIMGIFYVVRFLFTFLGIYL